MIPACAYAMVFLFASVLTTVEIPQLFAAKFHLNAKQLGLQFIGLIVGSIIGEQIGGHSSDMWMRTRAKKTAPKKPEPEFRLWLSYMGFVFAMVGLIVFSVRLQQAPQGQWNITPIVSSSYHDLRSGRLPSPHRPGSSGSLERHAYRWCWNCSSRESNRHDCVDHVCYRLLPRGSG